VIHGDRLALFHVDLYPLKLHPARIVREVETRTGRIIDSQKDVGGWPVR